MTIIMTIVIIIIIIIIMSAVEYRTLGDSTVTTEKVHYYSIEHWNGMQQYNTV